VKKIAVIVLALALVVMFAMVAPAMACKTATKPEVVPFGLTAAMIHDIADGTFWWTGGGTTLHVRGLTKEMAFLVGAIPNTVNYGFATITTDYVFNTATGKGIYTRTWEMTFVTPYYYYKPGTPPTGNPNPYGIGTLEGIEVGKATSIMYQLKGDGSFNEATLSLADFKGILVAAQGTGDFKKAILLADTLGYPFGPPGMPPVTIRINLGNTISEPTGKLVFYG
jgi:hypothetical protein